MVDEAADQGVSDQPRRGHAAVDDLRLHGLLHQARAAAAGPFAADVAVHEELRRHDVEPLADILTDAQHRLAAVADGALGLMTVQLDRPEAQASSAALQRCSLAL